MASTDLQQTQPAYQPGKAIEAGGNIETKLGRVQEKVQHIEISIEQLESKIQRLSEKLDPIMIQDAPDEAKADEPEIEGGELVRNLNSKRFSIDIMSDRIQNLIDRLDV